MKILHLITSLSTGGAERALYSLLAEGTIASSSSMVVSLRDEGTFGARIEQLGISVSALHMGRRWSPWAIVYRLRHIAREFRPNIIQGWMYHGNVAASLSARLAPRRPAVVWNIRQSLYGLKPEKLLTRQVIRANRMLSYGVASIVYNSRLSRKQHVEFGFNDRRARVIPNGFDLDRLQPDRQKGKQVREELGLPSDAFVIGHVARFHPMKDQAGFLRAAVRVAGESPRARFLVVGRDVSPENPALAGIVPEALLERFVFTGERSDPERLMQAMDLLCSSSWSEAFPNVLGEAMACAVPCVVTDVGDSADIVGDTGIVVPPSNGDTLVGGMLAMLGKGASERERLGRAARERISNHYALPRVVERYADLYREIYANHGYTD